MLQGAKGLSGVISTCRLSQNLLMNTVISREFRGINGDGLAHMSLIRAGNLQSETAPGTVNRYRLALAQIMEQLVDVGLAVCARSAGS